MGTGTGTMKAEALYSALRARGIDRLTGVPCSFFGALFRLAGDDGRYVAAANEGAALATACGFALAERPAAVLIQNSGLGNLVNPLTSLAEVYGIGTLMLISHRGDPDGPPDEPQHRLMGAVTGTLLDVLGVPHWRLPGDEDRLGEVLDAVGGVIATGKTAALLVGRGTIEADHRSAAAANSARPSPADVLETITSLFTDEMVVSTTGYISRRLFAAGDRPGNFYMQGSMGHAISVGLGVALARPDRRVVVLDGDGASLMHLGALGTVGATAPRNLVHAVLDNGQYESTGGQSVPSVRFEEVAKAAGYRAASRVRSLGGIAPAVTELLRNPGPALLVIEVAASGGVPPRATRSLSPTHISSRFAARAASLQE